MKKKKKVLCVLSTLLGNKTLSQRFVDVFSKIEIIEPVYMYVGEEDYTKYSAPRFARLSCFLELAYVSRRKYQETIQNVDYDMIFVNGYEIAFGLRKEIEKHPTVLALDVIPSLVHDLLERTSKSWIEKFRSRVAGLFVPGIFKEMFQNVDIFLPMTKWCSDAISKEYGIDSNKIYVTYCPVDLKEWAPVVKETGQITLLFVGNDFYRKGGDFLLDIFGKFSSENMRLIIVSNDKTLPDKKLPDNIRIYNNIPHEKMLDIFNQADIFVFPTKKEYLGVAVVEALSMGLPVVTRDVGGLKEFVKDGYNGFLLPYYSTEEQWLEKIKYLIENSDERKRMGQNARKTAEEKFSMERFEKMMFEVMDRLTKEKTK